MTGTVLRVGGNSALVREFLASTHWKPCVTYFRGKPFPSTFSRKATHSGFNLNVSNAVALPSQVRSSVRFLEGQRLELLRITRLGLHGTLDFGVTSKPEAVFSFYRFPSKLLTLLATYSLGVEVSYYGQVEC